VAKDPLLNNKKPGHFTGLAGTKKILTMANTPDQTTKPETDQPSL
jgi:hypothetical protein